MHPVKVEIRVTLDNGFFLRKYLNVYSYILYLISLVLRINYVNILHGIITPPFSVSCSDD